MSDHDTHTEVLLTLWAAPNSLLLMIVHTSWLCAGERFACILALLLAAHDSSGMPSVNAPSQGKFRGAGNATKRTQMLLSCMTYRGHDTKQVLLVGESLQQGGARTRSLHVRTQSAPFLHLH